MNTAPTSTSSPDRITSSSTGAVVLPVIEEQVVIQRQVVETGKVQLSKTVREHEENLQFTLLHDEVRVERVPVNAFVADEAALPGVRYEGDTMIIPVVREVVVKRLLVVEELHITKHEVPTQETHRVVLRQEAVEVTRQAPLTAPGASPSTPQ